MWKRGARGGREGPIACIGEAAAENLSSSGRLAATPPPPVPPSVRKSHREGLAFLSADTVFGSSCNDRLNRHRTKVLKRIPKHSVDSRFPVWNRNGTDTKKCLGILIPSTCDKAAFPPAYHLSPMPFSRAQVFKSKPPGQNSCN